MTNITKENALKHKTIVPEFQNLVTPLTHF